MSKIYKVNSSGDVGDVIASLSTLKATGFKWDYHFIDRDFCKPLIPRKHIIQPLLECQFYINSVKCSEAKVDWPSNQFRKHYDQHRSLADAHAMHAAEFGFKVPIPVSTEPWLTVDPSKKSKNRVVIARSPRYHNEFFPWKEIVGFYKDRLMFMGLDEEYLDFCNNFGWVDRARTQSLLDVSRLIAGSLLFIGNQSSPWWCSEGLKHNRIQETHLRQCDSMLLGGDVQHVADGGVILPSFDKGVDDLVVRPKIPSVNIHVQTNIIPKTYFEIEGFKDKSFSRVMLYAKRVLKMDEADAKFTILTDMAKREPGYFGINLENKLFEVYSKTKNALASPSLSQV